MYDPIAHSDRVLEETGAHDLFFGFVPSPPLPSASIGNLYLPHREIKEKERGRELNGHFEETREGGAGTNSNKGAMRLCFI
jgi:hypothetical protein